MNIKISNFDGKVKENDLVKFFEPHGKVESAEVAMDLFTEQSRGFGFVEMPDEEEAQSAIKALNNSKLNEQVVSVQEAKPRVEHKGSYKVGDGIVSAYRFRRK